MRLSEIRTFVCTSVQNFEHGSGFSELAMLALHQVDVLAKYDDIEPKPQLPRIYDKCVLFFDDVQATSTSISGRRYFDHSTASIVRRFLDRQDAPICLVLLDSSGSEYKRLVSEFARVDIPLMFGSDALYWLDIQSSYNASIQNAPSIKESKNRKFFEKTLYSCQEQISSQIESAERRSITLATCCTFLGFFKSLPCTPFGEMSQNADTFQNRKICQVPQFEHNDPQVEDLDVETFVFIDLKTTSSAPRRDKIAEICMAAIHRDKCTPYLVGDSNSDVPRVADRLRLAVDPTHDISPLSARLNKFTRTELLERNKQPITEETLLLLTNFLDRQSQPVCMVAYCCNEFDFNFLRACILSFRMERFFDRYFSAQALVAIRQLGKASGKGLGSYSLQSAYANFTNKSHIQSVHSAEGDVDAMIEVLRCVNEPHSALKGLENIKKKFMKK